MKSRGRAARVIASVEDLEVIGKIIIRLKDKCL
jgi:hypothetical protein